MPPSAATVRPMAKSKSPSGWGGRRTAGPGKRIGRPQSSPGWSTISIKVPAPTRDEYEALPAEVKARLIRQVKELIDAAVAGR